MSSMWCPFLKNGCGPRHNPFKSAGKLEYPRLCLFWEVISLFQVGLRGAVCGANLSVFVCGHDVSRGNVGKLGRTQRQGPIIV